MSTPLPHLRRLLHMPTAPPTPTLLPTLSSASLDITSWEPLSPGGHSFVFKITTSTPPTPTVLKIFRFHTRCGGAAPRADPYTYFTREATSYALLSAAGLTGTIAPSLHGTLRISPAHEAALHAAGHLPGLSASVRRAWGGVYADGMPLAAVWMEYIPGRRLAPGDVPGLGGAVEGALWRVQGAGVRQGDVKWRNVLVVGEGERVVWVDFSNAEVRGGGEGGDQGWEERVAVERGVLRGMLGRWERRLGERPVEDDGQRGGGNGGGGDGGDAPPAP